jgi:DNA-binding response OmpR family regulator
MTVSEIKILIVEDNAALANLYGFKFEHENFVVRTAQNGEMGLAVTESFRPDLILLDLKMPVMNGDEMLERLRETEWGADIRVIVLTNISKDEAPGALRFLNVDRYIVKAHHTPAQIVDVARDVLGMPGKHKLN